MTDTQLDALVAEHVMGWTKYLEDYPDGEPGETYDSWDDDKKRLSVLPNYSTSMAAAWEVVEKQFSKTAFTFDHCENYVKLVVAWEGDLIEIESDTAPRAICLAALKAVGVSVE